MSVAKVLRERERAVEDEAEMKRAKQAGTALYGLW